MSRGFCIFAQNNNKTDYVRQAYALALSIKHFCPGEKVCIITNDKLTTKQKKVFDDIINIPWTDQSQDSEWKIENRWKIYHASPYNKTIVMDADMLLVNDIRHWWRELEKYKLFFVSNVRTYRNELVTTNYYRKTFVVNNLPNLYSGIHYFEKSDEAKAFFILLELIVTNWELFYTEFAKERYQKWCSIDLCAAIACKILGLETEITNPNSFITFTHMKTHAQNWHVIPEYWTKVIGSYLQNNGTLMLGNFVQTNVLHYVENEFLTDKIIKKLENL